MIKCLRLQCCTYNILASKSNFQTLKTISLGCIQMYTMQKITTWRGEPKWKINQHTHLAKELITRLLFENHAKAHETTNEEPCDWAPCCLTPWNPIHQHELMSRTSPWGVLKTPWAQGGPRSDIRDAVGEMAQVILVWVRAPGDGNASHQRRLRVTRVRPWAMSSSWREGKCLLDPNSW